MPLVQDVHLPGWIPAQELPKNRFGHQFAGTDAAGRGVIIQHLDPQICPDYLWEAVQQAVAGTPEEPADLFLPWSIGRQQGQLTLGEPARNRLSLAQVIWSAQKQRLTERTQREIYCQVMKPVLEACRAALERAPRPEQICLAPDHIFLVFPPEAELPRLTQAGIEGGKWPEFEIRFRPFCLRSLLPASVDGEAPRLEWLKAPYARRFAGLIYQVFQGRTFEEGCPEEGDFTPTTLLGSRANHALRGVMGMREGARPTQLPGVLLEAIFAREEATPERRKDRPARQPAQPGAKPGPDAAVPGKIRPDAPKKTPGPRPVRWGRVAGLGALLACGFGTVAWLARWQSAAPAPVVAPVVEGPKPAAPSLPPPGTNPENQPAAAVTVPPVSDPLQEADRLNQAGKPEEAITLLLKAAPTTGSGTAETAWLEMAARLGSPVASQRLAEAKLPGNPGGAADLYAQAWETIQGGKALPAGNFTAEAARSVAELKRLAAGDTLRRLAQFPAGSPLRPEALELFTAAATAYRQGGAAGPSNSTKALAVATEVKTLADRRLSINRSEAISGYLTATRCGSRNAALIWSTDLSGTVTPAEKQFITRALNTYINEGNANAMVALASLINQENPSAQESAQRQDLITRAAAAKQPDALFMKAQDVLSGSSAFGGVDASMEDRARAYTYLLEAAALGQPGAISMLRSSGTNASLSEAQRREFNAILQRRQQGTLPALE